jgi:hypothetical protein
MAHTIPLIRCKNAQKRLRTLNLRIVVVAEDIVYAMPFAMTGYAEHEAISEAHVSAVAAEYLFMG